jgi:hypothetical protein
MGVYTIKVVVQASKLFNFLTIKDPHGRFDEGVVKNWQNSTDEPISFESTYVFLFKGANETVPSSEIMRR